MRLYIAEKPSLARVIAKGLGVEKNEKGYIRCKNDAIVVCAFGHLLQLKDPDCYLSDNIPLTKNGTKVWRLEDLPIIPKKWEKEPISDKKEQLNVINKLMKQATDIVVCGDADREGQNLIEEIIEYYHCNKPLLRFWSQSTDDISVSRALKDLKNNDKYHPLALAAESRSRADWLIGMNFTRALTCANTGSLLSIGRVQTPLLKIIADRDDAIKNFKPKDFFGINATFDSDQGSYIGAWQIPEDLLDQDGYLTEIKKAEEYAAALNGKSGIITGYEQKLKHQTPPIPFDLNELQKVCGKKFGFTPKKTLEIAQELYEEHQLTSYPRSSCGYLAENQKQDVETILKNLSLAFPEYAEIIEKTDPQRKSPIWDQKKVEESSHTGIIPTLRAISVEERQKLSDNCQKVYDLIAKRYIACFLEDYTYYETVVMTTVEDQLFKSVGKRIVNQGFKEFLNESSQESTEKDLPALKKEQNVKCTDQKITKSVTKAPAAFTLVSIVDAMTNCYKYVDDPNEKKLLKEGKGIGTVATRAAILDVLEKREFMSVTGKKQEIHITDKGRFLLQVAPERIKSVSLTAEAEEIMQRIQNKEGNMDLFLEQQETFVKDEIEKISKAAIASSERCPVCGHELKRFKSKFNNQYYWRCLNENCKKAFTDVNDKPGEEIIRKEVKKLQCPACGKDSVLHLESKKKPGTFYFWCTECKTSFTDENGKIGEKIVFNNASTVKKVKCPECGKPACGCYKNKNSAGKHWWCSECKASFADDAGKPGKKYS